MWTILLPWKFEFHSVSSGPRSCTYTPNVFFLSLSLSLLPFFFLPLSSGTCSCLHAKISFSYFIGEIWSLTFILALFLQTRYFDEITHHKKGQKPSRKVTVMYRKVKELKVPRKNAETICQNLLSTLPETCHNHIRAMFPVPMEAAEGTTTATGVPNHPDEWFLHSSCTLPFFFSAISVFFFFSYVHFHQVNLNLRFFTWVIFKLACHIFLEIFIP